MSKQTEAQRLAEEICDYSRFGYETEMDARVRRMGSHKRAAAELLRQEALIAELAAAARLVIAWYEAEENHAGTDFYQRMQMCRDSETALRAALAKVQQ